MTISSLLAGLMAPKIAWAAAGIGSVASLLLAETTPDPLNLQAHWPIWAVGAVAILTAGGTFLATLSGQVIKPWMEDRAKERDAKRDHEIELQRIANERYAAEVRARTEARHGIHNLEQQVATLKLLNDWYVQELERLGWDDPRDTPSKSRPRFRTETLDASQNRPSLEPPASSGDHQRGDAS
jgi:hypothetical protein